MGEVIILLFSKSGVLYCVAVLKLIRAERKKQSRCVYFSKSFLVLQLQMSFVKLGTCNLYTPETLRNVLYIKLSLKSNPW